MYIRVCVVFIELLIMLPDVKVLDRGVVLEALEDVGASLQAEVVAAQVEPLDESVQLQQVPHRPAALKAQAVGGDVEVSYQLVQRNRLETDTISVIEMCHLGQQMPLVE